MGLVIFKGDTKIGVYNFPNVKRPRLCVEKGNSVTAYATFRNEECAACQVAPDGYAVDTDRLCKRAREYCESGRKDSHDDGV